MVQIVPVIDLQAGQVVHAVQGDRARYRPIASRLCSDATPAGVAKGLAERLGTRRVYVADLDALAGHQPDWAALEAIASQGHRLLVDCGIGSPPRARAILRRQAAGASGMQFVVPLESLEAPERLAATWQALGEAAGAFSLDLRHGRIWNARAAWQAAAPLGAVQLAVAGGVSRILVLDLAAVGSSKGPVIGGLCRAIRAAFPRIQLLGGGGVRDAEDVRQLAANGCDAVLVGSALHHERLDADAIRACESPSRPPEEPSR